MKNRLHDKKAGLAILAALIIVSALEVVFRVGCMHESILATTNAGEPLATVFFATMLMIFTFKGKQRICYICYGAWLSCFVLDQMFGLPAAIADLAITTSIPGILSVIIRLVTMINIIAIGALLVEYMNDGTIYSRAFNVLSIITILIVGVDIFKCLYFIAFNIMPVGISAELGLAVFKKHMMLVVFNDIYRVIMLFLLTFFAYDSAKEQLQKTKLSK